MEIVWSQFAERQLDEIFDYHFHQVSPKVAYRLIIEIINESDKLIKTPYMGQVEELLKNRSLTYRYFLYKSYKIIYSIDDENNLIKIADVFDTRQNPTKIKRST